MKHPIRAMVVALLLPVVAACSSDAGSTSVSGLATTDDSTSALQRIVSLSPAATEMLFAVDAGDQVIAVDEFSNHPPEAPTTDLSGFQPNVEAIAGFTPDLVVSESPIEGLDVVGIENLVLPAAATIDDVYAQIELVGAATGKEDAAGSLVAEMQAAVADRLASIPELEAPLTYYHELDTTLYSVTSSTFVGQVYALFGLENIADPADEDGSSFGYPQLNAEYLVDADPDIIFLADTIFENQSAATVAERPGWDQLTAVREGRIVELNDDIASRWGPRIIELIDVVGAAVAEFAADAPGAA